MKIKDLIQALSAFNLEHEVYIRESSWTYFDINKCLPSDTFLGIENGNAVLLQGININNKRKAPNG